MAATSLHHRYLHAHDGLDKTAVDNEVFTRALVLKGKGKEALGEDVTVTFQAGQANNPNTNPIVENSNKQIRNVLRRVAQANRTTNQNDGKQKDWRSYWYGPQGVTFSQMRRLALH